MRELYPNSMIRSNIFEVAQKKFPALTADGFICFEDLRKISALHYEQVLKRERGALSELEKEVIESIGQHELLSENINEEFEEKLTFGTRLADRVAEFGGSWKFISLFVIVLVGWMTVNSLQFFGEPFDPYPYILLNLVLSCLAAIQAPIIMMSQNRQAAKDRLKLEHEYLVNLKSELQIRQLNARMELFMRHSWQKSHEMLRIQEEILQELDPKRL